MPKLSEIAGIAPAVAAPSAGKLRLSQAMAAPAAPQFDAASLPGIFGPAGVSGEFANAAGKTYTEGMGPAFKGSLADMFGSYDDVVNAVQGFAPGSKLVKDSKGYEVLELPNGKRFALNKPGIQNTEVAAGVGNIAAFLPAGKLASLGGGMATKAALAAGGSVATDAALQKVAGRDKIDPVRAALSGVGGAVGELVAPALGTLTNKAYNALKSKFGSHAKAVAAGRAMAQQAGIEQPSDTLSLQMLKRWDDIKNVSKKEAEAIAAEAKVMAAGDELGLSLTRGQKTGDMGQLTREEMLRNSDSMAGKMIRGTDADNQRAIVDYFTKMRSGMAGGEASGTVGDAFDKVGQNVRNEFGNANRVTGELYEKVAQTGAMVDAGAVREIPKVMKSAVADFPITRDLTPGAASLINLVKKEISSLPDEATAVSLKAVEIQRRRINQAIESASNPGDRRALTTMKNAFDGWFNKLDDAVVRGDPGAIGAMKNARAARASQGARFESRDPGDGGDLIEQMIEGRLSSDQLAEAAFGQGQVGKSGAVQFIRAAKKALKPEIGPMNPAFGELKSAFLQRMTVGKNGEPLGPQAIMNNLKTALNTRKDVMKELYTTEEYAKLSRAAQALDAIVPKGMIGRSSGTTERGFRFLEQLLGNVPFAKQMIGMMQSPANAMTAATMYQPIRPRGLGDELSVAAGASLPSQVQN